MQMKIDFDLQMYTEPKSAAHYLRHRITNVCQYIPYTVKIYKKERHDIAEILLKLVLNTNQSIN